MRQPVKLISACFILLACPLQATAQWSTISHKIDDAGSPGTMVAYTVNSDGYSMEIYIDTVNAVRGRFSLPDGLLAFPEKFCPSYQIDRGTPINRSINDAPCISSSQWVEYIIGHADGNKVTSTSLLALMNGISITFRFKLSNNDYRQTIFSLQGSKRAVTSAFGENVTVTKSP